VKLKVPSRNLFLLPIVLAVAVSFCSGEERVNVGTVTKYTGKPASQNELKNSELFLATLETQAAAEALKFDDIDYMDRSAVDQVFQELNLSSDVAFNPASGALKGLLGRLDFLIVIDASSPTVARMRALDNQTGAVRAVAICRRPNSSFASASLGDGACVRAFMGQLHPHLKKLLSDRLERKAAAQQQEMDAQERRAETAAMQPALEGAKSRLSAANSFWEGVRRQQADHGGIRPEIQSALTAANAAAARCQGLFDSAQPVALKTGITDLNRRLDLLDSYK
jgi:hypothetical protein